MTADVPTPWYIALFKLIGLERLYLWLQDPKNIPIVVLFFLIFFGVGWNVQGLYREIDKLEADKKRLEGELIISNRNHAFETQMNDKWYAKMERDLTSDIQKLELERTLAKIAKTNSDNINKELRANLDAVEHKNLLLLKDKLKVVKARRKEAQGYVAKVNDFQKSLKMLADTSNETSAIELKKEMDEAEVEFKAKVDEYENELNELDKKNIGLELYRRAVKLEEVAVNTQTTTNIPLFENAQKVYQQAHEAGYECQSDIDRLSKLIRDKEKKQKRKKK